MLAPYEENTQKQRTWNKKIFKHVVLQGRNPYTNVNVNFFVNFFFNLTITFTIYMFIGYRIPRKRSNSEKKYININFMYSLCYNKSCSIISAVGSRGRFVKWWFLRYRMDTQNFKTKHKGKYCIVPITVDFTVEYR